MKGWRRRRQRWRACATSARRCSVARSSFFVTEAEPAQEPSDRRTVRLDTEMFAQVNDKRIERQIALFDDPPPHPIGHIVELATARITLTFWIKSACLAAQLDHVVHEFRRNPEMLRRLTVTMAFIDKCHNALPKFNRM
jgi:hypothetical protein